MTTQNLKDLGRRSLSLLLVLVMCLGLMNITVFAEINPDAVIMITDEKPDGNAPNLGAELLEKAGLTGTKGTWESQDEEILTIDTSTGAAQGIKEGMATVTYTYQEETRMMI